MFKAFGVLALGFAITGCATSLAGSPHVAGGRTGCEAKCKEQGMSLAGMVFMGDYTSGCVCALPGQSAAVRQQTVAAAELAAGGVTVALRMRQQQQRQDRHITGW